jgi:NADH-quinone oxidoreductase subunit N
LLLVGAGLGFKLALVPFHLWAPDVYDGAPLPSTAFFAVLAKLAVLALAIRLVYTVLGPILFNLSPVLLALGGFSVLLGTFGALAQRRIKRLLAYSAIVHGGWVILALGAGGSLGLFAACTYSLVYLVLSLNLFGLLLPLRRRPGDRRPRTLEELAPLFRSDPPLAASLAANLLSLAGIPPLAGFGAKLLVLVALASAGHYPLAAGLVLLAVVSAVYYIRLLRILFFDRPLRWILLRPLGPAGSLAFLPATLANLLLLPLAFGWLPLPLLLP